jgi:RNA polymerase sigma factor (sigma-70 family)
MQAIKTIPLIEDPLEMLIDDCKRVIPNSQERLYRHCYPLFINTCLRYGGDMDGAGTIFNNAFMKVFKSIGQYQSQQKARAWIKTIIIHCSIDYFKQRNRIKEISDEAKEAELGTFDETIFQKITIREIHKIIREIPTATATVFNLFVFEELSHNEIAKLVGISENTSKWHVNAGRNYVKQRVEELSKIK